MKIVITSENKSKLMSLLNGMCELGLENTEIIPVNVQSGVSSKPVDSEILTGCVNRNNNARKIAESENIDFDYLCSIEGGFEWDINGYPFIVSYVLFEDKNGNKSTGKSLGLRITKNMMKYLEDGNSLNKLIEFIDNKKDNKQNGGITGYLSKGLLNRCNIDKDAVISAFVPIMYGNERELLDLAIRVKKENE